MRERVTVAYRVGLALFTLVALGIQYVTASSRPTFDPVNFFSYFTNLSNIYGAAVFLYVGLTGRRSLAVDLVRGATVLYLGATGVVYAVLLAEESESLGIVVPWINTVIHEVMPLAVVLDWLLDPPTNRLPLRLTRWWIAFPVLYFTYSLVRGAIVDWYPYPFLNPARAGGAIGVAAYAVAILIWFVLIILAATWIGNRLGTRRTRRQVPALATA